MNDSFLNLNVKFIFFLFFNKLKINDKNQKNPSYIRKVGSYFVVLLIPTITYASDPLAGTTWKTIDDKTNQPAAIVKFSESKNGILNANIQRILLPNEEHKCTSCKGYYKNKSLIGLTIIKELVNIRPNEYGNGKILDPQNGKIYSFSAQVSSDGQKLIGRGYIGISVIGRNQTWYRIN